MHAEHTPFAGMLPGAGRLPIGQGSGDATSSDRGRPHGSQPRPHGSGVAEAWQRSSAVSSPFLGGAWHRPRFNKKNGSRCGRPYTRESLLPNPVSQLIALMAVVP